MINTRIKICGVTCPKLATEAVALGANYIGLVFHPSSKRNIDINKAKAIAFATHEAGGQTVAVFVDQTFPMMQAILTETKINIAQLHGSMAKASHVNLPDSVTRIFVQIVADDGTIINDANNGLSQCQTARDLLLFDAPMPGQGKVLPWEKMVITSTFRFGIAGGLTANNVSAALTHLPAYFVDVSSGVENTQGVKDVTKIQDFIRQVRGMTHANS